jgi:hypothetical protein
MSEAAYQSYLLRLWRARSGEHTVWRASLENPHTGERVGFASLKQLLAFLEDQLGAVGASGSGALPREEGTTYEDTT